MRGEGACVLLRDDGANGDEHPLLASGHVGEHCSVYAENRKDVRVKGHLDCGVIGNVEREKLNL